MRSVRSLTNYGGEQLPSEVWTKIDYIERQAKGNKKPEPTPVSKPEGQDLAKPVKPRRNKKLDKAVKADLRKRNIGGN